MGPPLASIKMKSTHVELFTVREIEREVECPGEGVIQGVSGRGEDRDVTRRGAALHPHRVRDLIQTALPAQKYETRKYLNLNHEK